jgi:hypothetical protein
MSRLLTVAILLFAAIALAKFWPRILVALKRFDERNVARERQENIDRQDQLAHFRHTLKLAEEQVEDVSELETRDARTGLPVTLYVFEGEHYATRREAERAREDTVRGKARAFYVELPAALVRRGKDRLH